MHTLFQNSFYSRHNLSTGTAAKLNLMSWIMLKIQHWIAGWAIKKIAGAWTIITHQCNCMCTKEFCSWMFQPSKISLIYISALNKEGAFTEKRSIVNAFITTTLKNSSNSEINPHTKTKQKIFKLPMNRSA